MYRDLLTIGTWGHPSLLRHADVLNGWSLRIINEKMNNKFWIAGFLVIPAVEKCLRHNCISLYGLLYYLQLSTYTYLAFT